MRSVALVVAILSLVACRSSGGSKPLVADSNGTGASEAKVAPPVKAPPDVAPVAPAPSPVPPPAPPVADAVKPPEIDPPAPEPAPPGHDFIAEVRELRDIALCVRKEPWAKAAKVQAQHCERIQTIQEKYRDKWQTPATSFFASVVAPGLPTTVVYPFAGGDLATALTVFPDARDITTLSLEPAGDPRTLAALTDKQVATALGVVADELDFLYRINFSNTINLIGAMRGGQLPTQLVFSLSALELHGYEVTAAYFFDIKPDGTLAYIDDAELAKMPPVDTRGAATRNKRFSNVELHFKKPGDAESRVYRHIEWNLDDDHLEKDARVITYLAAKGKVAAMTKAASYLLHWGSFSIIRNYLLDHMVWMVSDASGIPLKFAAPRGWTQEVWGTFTGAHMNAGKGSNVELLKLFKEGARRPMPVRFGYPDRAGKPHLIVTRKP